MEDSYLNNDAQFGESFQFLESITQFSSMVRLDALGGALACLHAGFFWAKFRYSLWLVKLFLSRTICTHRMVNFGSTSSYSFRSLRPTEVSISGLVFLVLASNMVVRGGIFGLDFLCRRRFLLMSTEPVSAESIRLYDSLEKNGKTAAFCPFGCAYLSSIRVAHAFATHDPTIGCV